MAYHAIPGAPESTRAPNNMMSRSTTSSVTGRASAMRRLRRRASAASSATRLYCRTNGCASFLDVDPTTGVAQCLVCGYVRRPN
jgi:hypothetical protein